MRVVLLIAIFIGVTIGIGWPQSPPIADIATPPATAPPPPSSSNTPRRTVVARSPSGHFLVDGEVNGQKVRFVVDTGASTVALTIADARRIGLPFDPARFAVVASGASGAVRGEIIELGSVALDGKRVMGVEAAVLEGLRMSLLGQSYLRHIRNVQISQDKMILE